MNIISELNTDLNIISKLSDQPNKTDGLNSSKLKAKFDLAGNTIKDFINGTLVAKVNELVAKVNELVGLAHSHANKDLLDTYTQKEADLSTAVADMHTHSNKAALDTVTADAVHTHKNKAVLDTVTADTVSSAHTHGNKSVLDGITSANLMIAGAHQTFGGTKTFSDGIVDNWSFTLGNIFVGTENALYGNGLPTSGTVGQIFFLKV